MVTKLSQIASGSTIVPGTDQVVGVRSGSTDVLLTLGALSAKAQAAVSTDISGLATGIAAFLATPSSANLLSAMTTSTGTGNNVFATSPTLTTPNIGAASGASLNLSGLTASSALATDASKNLVSVTNTGSGNNVLATAPTITGATITTSTINGVTPTTGGSSSQYLNGTGAYSTPSAKSFSVSVQKFTNGGSTTYTPTPGTVYSILECMGAGGAGGSCSSTSSTQTSGGGGGGAGGYSRHLATAADIGVSQTVSVGAGGTAGSAGNNPGGNGGDTSVGSLCVGKGGTGGGGSAATIPGLGGAGGVAGTGNIVNQQGAPGTTGIATGITGVGGFGGAGGNSQWGGGGAGTETATTTVGNAAVGYGGGGSGGANYISQGTGKAGGAGANGYVVITEYIYA